MIIEEMNIPLVGLGNIAIPLFAPITIVSWALLNLISGILGGILTISTIANELLRRRHQNQEYEVDYVDFGSSYRNSGESRIYIDEKGTFASDAREKQRKRQRVVWFFISIMVGIIGIVLFILTQDMTRAMFLVDVWTIAHIIFLLCGIVAFVSLTRGREKTPDEEDWPGGEGADSEADVNNRIVRI